MSAWFCNWETVRNIPIGRYTVEFKVVPGWRPEGTITVTVQANKATTARGFYLEQAGIMPRVMMLLLDEEE
jgi:hypothetical protein